MSQTQPQGADADVPFFVAPRPSDADLEKMARFSQFSEAVRDALGEASNAQELSPEQAAEQGCLSTLRSLHRRGYVDTQFCEDVCCAAARGGQIETLQWLRRNGAPWSASAIAAAASGGHIHVLRWMRANACPWDEDACARAAGEGNIAALEWLRDAGAPWQEAARAARRSRTWTRSR